MKLLPKNHSLRIGSSLGKLLFRRATSTVGELITINIYYRRALEASTSAQYQLFQKSYFMEKTNFLEEQHSALLTFSGEPTFSERLLFENNLFFIAASFSEELLFYKLLFQKRYCFTAMLPFHNYISYLVVYY